MSVINNITILFYKINLFYFINNQFINNPKFTNWPDLKMSVSSCYRFVFPGNCLKDMCLGSLLGDYAKEQHL